MHRKAIAGRVARVVRLCLIAAPGLGAAPAALPPQVAPAQSVDDGVGPVANAAVSALAVQPDGRIVAGGFFAQIGGAGRSYMARLNHDGSIDAAFSPAADGEVLALAVQPDGAILAGGYLTAVGRLARSYIARLHAGGQRRYGVLPGSG